MNKQIAWNNKTPAFGCPVVFVYEQRTESYQEYGEGVAQEKMRLGAKNSRGVASSAGNRGVPMTRGFVMGCVARVVQVF